MFVNSKQERRWILFSLVVLAVYLSPLLILQENAHIRIHDNLDSNLAWYKVLAKSGQLFGSLNGAIPQIINGILPRNAFGTEFSIMIWLYTLLPTMTAYALSQVLTRVTAFLGMYVLLKKHMLPDERWLPLNILTALAFSLTPFWPSGMLSTLGMPLALWAFLSIRKGEGSWKHFLVLTLLPFYSSMVLGFFFFLSAMGIFWLLDVIRGKGWSIPFLFSVGYMTSIYMLVEYRLMYSFLVRNEPNSRDEYFHTYMPFWGAVRLAEKNFIFGHTHVMTVHTWFILPALLLAFYLVCTKKLWRQEKIFVSLLALNMVLSFWYAFWFYEGWLPVTKKFHFLDTFNFARYHFLRPLIIYVSFALALKIISLQSIRWAQMAKGLAALQILLLGIYNDEIVYHNKPTVKQFYAQELFKEIKKHIALPQDQYRVASIGIHPAVAQYNGFYTLDTYNNFYPLSYKHKFRKIIEKELAKNKIIRRYFDQWGGRCYILSGELGKRGQMFKKESKRHLKHLDLNTKVFKKMGGRYIFSALPIDNAVENRLSLDKVFVSKTSAWKIYLYRAM
ncbi:hypothetical protein HPT25_02545 [Bacillus sp. BRMEA1]|uniref:DUF6044 family protein n=1 Tax=Neobacillus endophyticus TaxID=2738405 RepID=UPI0015633BE2|nr:DUF6044 family protein [Neobacillus endophyticus]NRD76366.1 hypothetical protein [Neobacillus endophyticus]